jgi:hypothetical protein
MRYLNLGRKFISQHILHQHWYICPIALPVRRNPQHRSLLTLVSATSTTPFQLLCHWWNSWQPVVNSFTRQTLPTVQRKHFFMNIFCIEFFCQQKMENRTLLFGSVHLKHGHHFNYWNHPLNMGMRVHCLDSHEAGLCCYLVIHIENLWHPLQLFYFPLWPIYWLTLVVHHLETHKVLWHKEIAWIKWYFKIWGCNSGAVVFRWNSLDVLEEHVASIFAVEE